MSAITRKDLAIKEFRKMWRWIAEETLKRKKIVNKKDYFYENDLTRVKTDCYLCEYSFNRCGKCDKCPIEWGNGEHCVVADDSPYFDWIMATNDNDYIKAAEFARKISELPERNETQKEAN